MRQIYYNVLLFIIVLFLMVSVANAKTHNAILSSHSLYFIENNGQIKDQFGEKRSDIQFYVPTAGFNVFVGKGQVHYQLKKVLNPIENLEGTAKLQNSTPTDTEKNFATPDFSICNLVNRVDVELLNSDNNAEIIFSEKQDYYENYYVSGCPITGIHAYSYNRITYKNVYPDIDWVFYLKNNKLEYEFIVGPKGDISKIKLQYSGAISTFINENNDLKIITSIGEITEHAPFCYSTYSNVHDELNTEEYLPSNYKLTNNILTYEIGKENNLVIDPGIEWGTYYGEDSSVTVFYGLTCDNMAKIYVGGKTYSSSLIATTGAFQITIGGDMDACLVKFDSSGNRIWATYYGSTGADWATDVNYDNSGHVYLGGCTSSASGMVTPGCQQAVYGGGMFNGFLAMFTSDGIRHWCTYLGGSSATEPASVCTDHIGHVYIAGLTNDGTNIATPGSCQPTHSGGHDLFVIQYDSLGVRHWGTYYGGPGDEFNGGICTDVLNNLYFCGWTFSASNISTTSSYQPTIGGGSDAFLVKFNSSGSRLWGTYYGGPVGDMTGSVAVDLYNYVYLLGTTSSDAGIATVGCSQPLRAGMTDAFLAKFDPIIGYRYWGTYFGGPGEEGTDYSKIVSDISGNIFITGTTTSSSGISTSGAWQHTYGGGDNDGFFAKFNGNGIKLWSSYLGGNDVDQPTAICYDGENAYVCGTTHSTNNIATPGSFLPTGGGLTFYNQGFLIKIGDYILPSYDEITDYNKNIFIYPSPNSGTFKICFLSATSENSIISIANLFGQVVMQFAVTGKEMEIKTDLPTGIYIISSTSQQNNFNAKLSIVR